LTAARKKIKSRSRPEGKKDQKAGAAAPGLVEKIEKRLGPWRVLGVMCVFSALYTFPLVFSAGSEVLGKFTNYYGDIFAGIWEFWISKYELLDLKTSPFHYGILAGPYSAYRLSFLAAHKYPVLMIPFTALLGPVASLNLFSFSNFVLTGFFTYLLVYHLTERRFPGVVAGLIFAFCPYAWARSVVHPDLAATWPLPLLVYSLLLFDRRRSLSKALLILLSLVIFHCYCSVYYYLFIPLVAGSYLLVRFVDAFIFDFQAGRAPRGISFSRIGRIRWILAGAAAVILIVGAVAAYKFYLASQAALEVRPLHWQERFKLSWANYLLPGVDHPLFGQATRSVVPVRRNVTESTAYIGWIPLLLALWGMRHAARKWQAWMLLVLGLGSLSFTLGPYLNLGHLRIPMPSLLLHTVAPFIRAIGRYSIFVQFSVALLAGYGFAALIQNWGEKASFNLVFAGIFLLGAVEYMHPVETTPVATNPKNSPPVYAYLASLEPGVTVFEYPSTAMSGLAQGDYLYFQTIHKKNLFNRTFDTSTIPSEYLPFWLDLDYPGALSDPNNVALLSYFGVDYVAFHDKSGTETQSLPTVDLSNVEGLQLVREFGKDAVYRVAAEPATVLLSFDTGPYYNYLEVKREYGEYDFDPPLTFGSGTERLGWRIMHERGRLRMRNLLDTPQKVELQALGVSFIKPRTLEIVADGRQISRLPVDMRPQELVIGPLELPAKGELEFLLQCPEGVSEVPIQGGSIRASVALARLKIRKVE